MLDIKYIRSNLEEVKQNCLNRNVDIDFDKLLNLDNERVRILKEMENLGAIRNQQSKSKPTEQEIEERRSDRKKIKNLELDGGKARENFELYLKKIPNLTHPDVPIGAEEDFQVIEKKGAPPKFSFTPKDHEELLTNLDLIDFERGAKVSGAKFCFAKNDLVKLNLALIQYGIDIVTKHGYTLMETPDLAKNEILDGIGFNPRGEETQVYSIENSRISDSQISLIGTAEITVGGYHADEILDFSGGPKKYVALSHCFRTEAGAYGKESKGLYRVHQFTKLEMFIYCRPEESEEMHRELLGIEKEIVDGLEIPYQIIDVASGDLGGPAYRKYDIEAWMTMKNDYGEITSTSNCTDYQARRLRIRYKKNDGTVKLVHTLNGTAIVTSRFPLAIVENHQQEDGSINIPKALQAYMGKTRISR